MKYCADVKEPMKSFSSDVIVGTGFAMSNLNISKKKKFDSERTKYDLFSVDLRQPSNIHIHFESSHSCSGSFFRRNLQRNTKREVKMAMCEVHETC
ncbi:hypothetical protein L3Y34_003813 [Caenorhabditis briggsae]|uniref:Uncharacterized protein n=1 Tax=Caenorhabditis briggsae TaxID=6238 RepID=A0AAE9A7C0_CAEBR|nr:hypothetical protein L3Y34_003813 [Caenorhabditis briggsae]